MKKDDHDALKTKFSKYIDDFESKVYNRSVCYRSAFVFSIVLRENGGMIMMRKKRILATTMAVIVAFVMCFGSTTYAASKKSDYEKFNSKINIGYSLGVMEKLMSFGTNDYYGFRTAGSSAELAAADYLYDEFKKNGLTKVKKEEVTIDTFEFKNADITYNDVFGEERTVELAAYQTTYQAENEKVDIVYAGEGTSQDYDDLNVDGKIVLIDIDQYNNWWVNWPAYQAKIKGAKAIITINNTYCSYSEDTVGVQDFCGPSDAPAFSISAKEGKLLKRAIVKNGGAVSVVLNADSKVEHDGVGYNIVGEIKGKTKEVIYLYGHYDAYFRAFADNTSGIGCIMGIVRALDKSGYQPQKTIRVVAHCAEEWGVDDSRYDWARGAEVQTQNHPEWAKKAFIAINIDSGVVCGTADGVELTAPYELAKGVVKAAKSIDGTMYESIKGNSPSWTWTESYSYSKAGIPVVDSGYYGEGADHTSSYHSSSDTKQANNYSPVAFKSSHKLYGGLLIKFDKMKVRPFDYTSTFKNLKASINSDVNADADKLISAVDNANKAAKALKKKTNGKFTAKRARTFNSKNNTIFKKVTNDLFGLDWAENNDFIHVYKQNNIEALEGAIAELEGGNIQGAIEWLWAVDLGWYASFFDEETFDYYVNQVLGPDAENSWGEGKLTSHAKDLWDIINSLQVKSAEENTDVSAEIQQLKDELETEKSDLHEIVTEEIKDIKAITKLMKSAAK